MKLKINFENQWTTSNVHLFCLLAWWFRGTKSGRWGQYAIIVFSLLGFSVELIVKR